MCLSLIIGRQQSSICMMGRRRNTQKISQIIRIKIRETCGHVKVRRVEGVFFCCLVVPPPPALPWKQRAPDEVLQQVNTNTPHHRSYSINTANALPQPYLETYGLFLTAEGKPALMLNSGIILEGKNGDPFKISKLQRRRCQESLFFFFFFSSLAKHTSFQKFPLMRIVSLASFSLAGETVSCSEKPAEPRTAESSRASRVYRS